MILADVIKEEINIGLVDSNDSDSQWRMYIDLLSAFVEAPKAKVKNADTKA